MLFPAMDNKLFWRPLTKISRDSSALERELKFRQCKYWISLAVDDTNGSSDFADHSSLQMSLAPICRQSNRFGYWPSLNFAVASL